MKKLLVLLALSLVFVACGDKECEDAKDRKGSCVEKGYNEYGDVISEVPYKNNKIEGTVKEYNNDGKLQYEVPFKNGRAEGTAKGYDANGKLVFSIKYKSNDAISAVCENNKKEIPSRYVGNRYQIKKFCEQ